MTPFWLRTTIGVKPTTRSESLIIPIRKALLEIELTVSNELETAQHQCEIAATDYNQLILLPLLIKKVREFAPSTSIIVR